MSKILYFVKIGKAKYIQETVQKGQFYMNTCEYFRDLATKEDGDLVGDLQECSFPHGTELIFGTNTMTPYSKEDPGSSALCCGTNYCIYCTYAICADYLPHKDKISANVFKGIIGKDDPTLYSVLVFTKPRLILERIATELSKRGLIGRCDFVQYDDHDYIPSYRFGSDDYLLDLCFHKRSDFIGQNEYRIATINKVNKEIDDLFICPLEKEEYEMLSVKPNCSLVIDTGKLVSNVSFYWEAE